MDKLDVSHRELYDRLVTVEGKVDQVSKNTKDVVDAFMAAQGAFKVLEWLARAAKPILWIGGLVTAVGVLWQNFKGHS